MSPLCPQGPGPHRHPLPPKPLVPGGKAEGTEKGRGSRKLQGVPKGQGLGDETGHSAEDN